MSKEKPINPLHQNCRCVMFRYRDTDGNWFDMDGIPVAEPKGPEWNPCKIEKTGIRIFKFVMN